MSSEFVDIAYKTGAGRYLQEPHALSFLGQEVRMLGTKAFVLGGPHSLPLVRDTLEASLAEASVPFEAREYSMPPMRQAAHALADRAREHGCDVVVGVGGGRMMDIAKAVGCVARLPVVLVPTSMATCAAFSPISVMYTDEDARDGTWRFTREVDAVIVDMHVMAAQPPRLVAAGVLDAMAKVAEIENGSAAMAEAGGSIQRLAAYRYACVNNEVLVRYGKQAFCDAGAGQITEALEQAVFAGIALTGIVSSLTRGFHQTALAHNLYDNIRTIYGFESAPWLHGELVAIGLLMQLVYNGQPERVPQLRAFMQAMDMPRSLSEVGLDSSDARFGRLRDAVVHSEFVGDGAEDRQRAERAFDSIEI